MHECNYTKRLPNLLASQTSTDVITSVVGAYQLPAGTCSEVNVPEYTASRPFSCSTTLGFVMASHGQRLLNSLIVETDIVARLNTILQSLYWPSDGLEILSQSKRADPSRPFPKLHEKKQCYQGFRVSQFAFTATRTKMIQSPTSM